MLSGTPVLDGIGEAVVTDMIMCGITNALQNGRDVILDQTNCKYRYIYRLIEDFKDIADIKFKIMIEDIPTLKKRNQLRAIDTGIPPIPDHIIEAMHTNQRALFALEEFQKDLEEYGRLV
jgi:hypothetical protein